MRRLILKHQILITIILALLISVFICFCNVRSKTKINLSPYDIDLGISPLIMEEIKRAIEQTSQKSIEKIETLEQKNQALKVRVEALEAR